MELYTYNKDNLDYSLNFKKSYKSSSGIVYHKHILNFKSAYSTGIQENDMVYCELYSKKKVYRKASGKKTSSTVSNYTKTSQHAPLVIFLHGFATNDKKIENYSSFIKKLMDFNINCLFINLPFHLNRRPANELSGKRLIYFDDKETLLFFHQSVVDIRKSLDVLENIISTKKVYLLGISLGSMISSVAAAFEPKIDKTILVLGGGRWEEVHWNGILKYILKGNCDDDRIMTKSKCHDHYLNFDAFSQKLKEENPDRITFDLEGNPEIKNHCAKKCFLCDPIAFAYKINPKNIMMINSRIDHFFSKKSTVKLWDSLGKPEIYWLNYPHVSKIISRKNVFERIIQFFDLKP